MMQDKSGRFVVGACSDATGCATALVRYDTRWRLTRAFPLTARDKNDVVRVQVMFGAHNALVIAQNGNEEIEVTVRPARAPNTVRAAGLFRAEKWEFFGDKSAWEDVPEYILVPFASQQTNVQHNALLRIADDATIDKLDDHPIAQRVVHVRHSRFVLLSNEGAFTLYDAVARKAIRHIVLNSHEPHPIICVRDENEFWVNDCDTLLKFDLKNAELIDAAGSTSPQGEPSDAPPPPNGCIAAWDFARNNNLCVLLREHRSSDEATDRPQTDRPQDVLALDAVTMHPVAHAWSRAEKPCDIGLVGRNTLLIFQENGTFVRKRLRRVYGDPAADTGPMVRVS